MPSSIDTEKKPDTPSVLQRAGLITIGDELLNGSVPDGNATYIARRLDEIGVGLEGLRTVPDRISELHEAIEAWEGKYDLILLTGGLGPTGDDITRTALAEHYGVGIERDERIVEDLFFHYRKRGREPTEKDLQQADMPMGARLIRNPHGSAPGIRFDRKGSMLIALPGVPNEMRTLLEEQLIPLFLEIRQASPCPRRSMLTTGMGESMLMKRLQHLIGYYEGKGVEWSFFSSPGAVRIRSIGRELEDGSLLDEAMEALRKELGDHFVGTGDLKFEEFLAEHLSESGKSLATAESCTGGYIAHLLTSVAGSSAYFRGGVVAYSNEVKKEQLGVRTETLEAEGAVSEGVVREMAEGVRQRLGSGLGLATSGIMGPSGGSDEKPIGTTWVGVSDGERTYAEKWRAGDQRLPNIERAAKAALNLLRKRFLIP